MLPRLSSAWVVSLLTLGLIRGSLTADAPIGVTTLECETATAEDAAGALFHEVELSAYRIEALARRCSAILAGHAEDTREHLTAWLEILEDRNRSAHVYNEALAAAGRFIERYLSVFKRCATVIKSRAETIS